MGYAEWVTNDVPTGVICDVCDEQVTFNSVRFLEWLRDNEGWDIPTDDLGSPTRCPACVHAKGGL